MKDLMHSHTPQSEIHNPEINRFIIRVYGIWISDEKVLLVEETVKRNTITKFPGGGLEFGEGIIDCLKREFKEELGIKSFIVLQIPDCNN